MMCRIIFNDLDTISMKRKSILEFKIRKSE